MDINDMDVPMNSRYIMFSRKYNASVCNIIFVFCVIIHISHAVRYISERILNSGGAAAAAAYICVVNCEKPRARIIHKLFYI